MSSASEWVREAGDADFDAEVIERSHELPVLVDFWAPWCGPCRMLGPVLEGLAEELGGKFVLVKVNTEDHQRIAMKYAIRSIPAVKLFSGGKVVDEFVGALPGGDVRKFIEKHLPDPTSDEIAAALAQIDADPDTARDRLQAVVAAHPERAKAHLGLARLALRAGDTDAARKHATAVDPSSDQADVAQHYAELADVVAAAAEMGTEDELRRKVEAGDDVLDAGFGLGARLAQCEQWADALEAFLQVVMRNAKHDDRAAHRAMVTIFGIMSRDDEARDEYQRKLQIYT